MIRSILMRVMCKTVGNDLQVSPNLVSVLGCRTPQIVCFSFHPCKMLTTGEGSMITAADDGLAAYMRRMRHTACRYRTWRAMVCVK
jgi:hypothetical protein